MKINWKSKSTKFVIGLVIVIITPIIYHQVSTSIAGQQLTLSMSQPKTVQVACPMKEQIYPQLETTGRIEAKYSVNIVARVSGWLQNRFFEEGNRVKKGQKLFVIEPDEYQFAAKNAQATVNENKALFINSEIELKRAEELLKENLVSREYFDNALTKRNQSRAALDGAIAQLNKANLDVSYTNITSPMDGRIGKILITEGNYVTPSSGIIATIYSTSPMKVIFTLKSADYIEIKKYFIERQSIDYSTVKVKLKLADGSIYNLDGNIEFVDNKVDETTGSVTMRAIFDNPDELLIPGDFVNVILELTKPHEVMVIPQSVTKTDVGTGYYVWVVDENNKTLKRDITVEGTINNNWIVTSGLKYTDKVIMKGIQSIFQSGQTVTTEPYVPEEETDKLESKAE